MTWTTTPPTEPGWYWYHEDGDWPEVVELLPEADRSPGRLCVYRTNVAGGAALPTLPAGSRWAGPLPMPDPA